MANLKDAAQAKALLSSAPLLRQAFGDGGFGVPRRAQGVFPSVSAERILQALLT
jgi:hypothetical protein